MSLPAAISELLDQTIGNVQKLQGGSLSEIWRAHLSDGTNVIAKHASGAAREADMLRELAAAGVRVPEVFAASDDLMVMEDLSPIRTPQSDTDWRALAELLAPLRQNRSDRFGWREDHAFDSVLISNAPDEDWSRFWAEKRLIGPAKPLDAPLRRRLDQLAAKLDELLPKSPPAALLHGDLWIGNAAILATGEAAIIDPACYYGDHFVDLAMLDLFASPPALFWEALDVTEREWPTLCAVYQLWPVIVHIRLFGGSYRGMLEERLRILGV